MFCSGALSRRPGKGSTALAAANAALEAAGRGLANDFGPRCGSPLPRNVATTLKVCHPCLLQIARQHRLSRTHSHRNGLKQAFMCCAVLARKIPRALLNMLAAHFKRTLTPPLLLFFGSGTSFPLLHATQCFTNTVTPPPLRNHRDAHSATAGQLSFSASHTRASPPLLTRSNAPASRPSDSTPRQLLPLEALRRGKRSRRCHRLSPDGRVMLPTMPKNCFLPRVTM